MRYATSRQDLVGTYLVDMNAMFFGMPMALFPAIAKGYGGPEVLGLLYAAPSAGSIAVTLTSGWTARVHRHGRAVVYGAALWGVAIVGFGLADALWLAVACLAWRAPWTRSAASSARRSGTRRSRTICAAGWPGIEMISWSSGPLLGDAEAGLLAALTSVRASVVSGGIACVVGTVALAVALPRFWGYDSRTHAAGEGGSVANVTDVPA